MAFDPHKNFAYSTVATAPSPATSGTSLVVAAGDGSKFPSVPFEATIWPTSAQPLASNAEVVTVTAISTDTLTIVRAQEGSTARTVVVGDQIAATITSRSLTDTEETFLDDFVSGGTNSGSIGKGWIALGGTAVSQASFQAVASHPGVLRRNTGTTQATIAATYVNPLFIPADNFEMEWLIRLTQVDVNTDFSFGLADDATQMFPSNFVGIIARSTDTNFQGRTSLAGTQSLVDTTVAIAAATWFKLKMRRKDASTIAFSVNGSAEVTLTTNIPTAGLQMGCVVKNTGAAADKSIDIDRASLVVRGTGR